MEPSLNLLKNKYQTGINRPVWLNADILPGPNVPGFWPVVNGTRWEHKIPFLCYKRNKTLQGFAVRRVKCIISYIHHPSSTVSSITWVYISLLTSLNLPDSLNLFRQSFQMWPSHQVGRFFICPHSLIWLTHRLWWWRCTPLSNTYHKESRFLFWRLWWGMDGLT